MSADVSVEKLGKNTKKQTERLRQKRTDIRVEYTRRARQAYEEQAAVRKQIQLSLREGRLQAEDESAGGANGRNRKRKAENSQAGTASSQEHGRFHYTNNTPMDLLELLGRGGHGEVWACKWHGCDLAVKIRRSDEEHPGGQASAAERTWDLAREYTMLSLVGQHPNIIESYELLSSTSGRAGLVMSRADCNLYELAHSMKCTDEETWSIHYAELGVFFKQCLAGLAFVHDRGMVRLDVKTNNWLIHGRTRVVLADFGNSRKLNFSGNCQVYANCCFNHNYRPLELILAEHRKAGEKKKDFI